VYRDKIRSQVALVAAMLLLICCAFSGLWLVHQRQKADGWVRHTFEVQEHLSRVRVGLLRAEVYRRALVLGDQDARDTLADVRRRGTTLNSIGVSSPSLISPCRDWTKSIRLSR
jgi:hypothetical protein